MVSIGERIKKLWRVKDDQEGRGTGKRGRASISLPLPLFGLQHLTTSFIVGLKPSSLESSRQQKTVQYVIRL